MRVLSVHRTVMAPRSSIADRRLTITFLRAIRAARHGDGGDHRQEFGREPHCEGHGEHQRLD